MRSVTIFREKVRSFLFQNSFPAITALCQQVFTPEEMFTASAVKLGPKVLLYPSIFCCLLRTLGLSGKSTVIITHPHTHTETQRTHEVRGVYSVCVYMCIKPPVELPTVDRKVHKFKEYIMGSGYTAFLPTQQFTERTHSQQQQR